MLSDKNSLVRSSSSSERLFNNLASDCQNSGQNTTKTECISFYQSNVYNPAEITTSSSSGASTSAKPLAIIFYQDFTDGAFDLSNADTAKGIHALEKHYNVIVQKVSSIFEAEKIAEQKLMFF